MKLEFDSVCAAYRGKPIVEQISFGVEQGSITALIGRNGAGKSTLISCLMGEKRDYAGRIFLDHRDVRQFSMMDLARQVACLPQDLPRPHVMVRDLVSFGRTPYLPLNGKLEKQDAAAVDLALAAVHMERYAHAFVDTLSGGERKKAFFAMTLAQDTPVVVLDEPTAHLDAVSRFEFLELVETMRRQTRKTFLLVMHDLPDVLRCADRILVLHERKLVFDGTPGTCLAADVPGRCFGVKISGDKEHGFAVMPRK